MKILYLTQSPDPPEKVWTPAFREALAKEGFVVQHTATAGLSAEQIAALIRQHEVMLLSWGSPPVPETIADNPGALRYICHLNGSVRGVIPEGIFDSQVVVTNWGDSIGPAVAEGTLTLLLACLKNIRPQIEDKLDGQWVCSNAGSIGSLQDLKLGLYGFGHIGRCFHQFVRPLGPDVRIFDPYANEIPDDCRRVGSLRDLFSDSEAIAIFAALTEETRESVDRDLLALLPDQAIVVNTARGDIIRQDDLLAEVASGRLRAGLDVLAGEDWIPINHEAIQYKNLILTSHRVGDCSWQTPISNEGRKLAFFHKTCIQNLVRYRAGESLRHIITRARYARMT
ncbi:MAG: hypothetical protein Fur0032_06910 [Terrimicrobiaceae bacterium]